MIEGSAVLRGARFFSEIVPDALAARQAWGERLVAFAAGADLVFLDPDNGLEIPSLPLGRKGSSKFAAWREVEELWRGGSSVLIYSTTPARRAAGLWRPHKTSSAPGRARPRYGPSARRTYSSCLRHRTGTATRCAVPLKRGFRPGETRSRSLADILLTRPAASTSRSRAERVRPDRQRLRLRGACVDRTSGGGSIPRHTRSSGGARCRAASRA